MTLQDYFKQTVIRLKSVGYENAAFEARVFIMGVLNLSHEQFSLGQSEILNEVKLMRLEEGLKRRCLYEPLAKIVGYKEFWGLPFQVNQYTLDPRPDSETLIEAVLNSCRDRKAPLQILDLGTGSGCLILSLLHEMPHAKGLGVDISREALEIAQLNAQRLGLSDRCRFEKSNWFEKVDGGFDIIISNPPYIPESQLKTLDPAVAYDPMLALTPGETGLESYEKILAGIRPHMNDQAQAFFEIGFDQCDAVSTLIEKNAFTVQAVYKDLANKQRVVKFNI